jgi:hypothetical protein
LAVNETGADTFAASGTVSASAITGTLAATETGSDTFESTGDVLVSGTLAVTETGADTITATGTVPVSGSLDAYEGEVEDTFAATGTVPVIEIVTGEMAAVETGADELGGYVETGYVEKEYVLPGISGKVLVQGEMSVSEIGADTFAGAGSAFVGHPNFAGGSQRLKSWRTVPPRRARKVDVLAQNKLIIATAVAALTAGLLE